MQAFTFPSITEALLQNFDRRNVGLRLEPTSTGDTRNNMSAYALLSAIVPFAIRRPLSSGPGWPGLSGDVAFLKLSKLLNQEDALSAPC